MLTPLVSLHIMLDARLPTLSPGSRAAVAKLVTGRGLYGDANAFARGLGLRDRYQLTYLLGRDGLRSLRTLAGWVRVAVWLVESELQGTSLCRAALAEAQDPGSRYRLVKRLTGLDWSQVRSRGLLWFVEELVEHCTVGSVGDPGRQLPPDVTSPTRRRIG